ncbi:MAG: ferredoxin--NADP reductase [Zavarzinella sp.]
MLPEEIEQARQQRYNGTVVHIRKPYSDLMVLRVRPDFPVNAHRAGQYCTLGLGNWEPRTPGCQEENLSPESESKLVRRAYSISCSMMSDNQELLANANHDSIEFYITLVREGSDPSKPPALTPRLFMLKEGDRLNIGEKITGHYTLEGVQPTDNVLLLGTGTGEAPHNYMAWELLRNGHQGKIVNVCCVRYRKDLGYLATHEAMSGRFSNYEYVPLTTRESDNVGSKMYIQDLISTGKMEEILGGSLDPAGTHVFLCGNPAMIGIPTRDKATGVKSYPTPVGVIEVLEQRGFTADETKVKGNIHFEKYW